MSAREYPFTPMVAANALQRLLANGGVILTADGLEKRCSRCKEYWPADTEFYVPKGGTALGLSSWCRACLSDAKQRVSNGTQH